MTVDPATLCMSEMISMYEGEVSEVTVYFETRVVDGLRPLVLLRTSYFYRHTYLFRDRESIYFRKLYYYFIRS